MSDEQPAANAIPPVVYGLFAGAIDQLAVQRFHNAFSVASQGGVRTIHLLFHSVGGTVGEGISLYNLFRMSPVEIVLYNTGNVLSTAVTSYLGATKRIVSAYGAFMVHRAYLNPVGATSDKLAIGAGQLAMEDERSEAIIKAHTKMPPERWDQHKYADVWLSAQEAVDYGFADAIGEFSPPPGTRLFNVWPPQN